MKMINSEFPNLSNDEISQILKKYNLEDIAVYIDLGTDTIQIDGHLTIVELKALVEIMQAHLDKSE